jgi:hypothetical protein
MSLVVEHDTSKSGRWLRDRRFKLALWVAVVEGALVVFDVIPWWLALTAAAGVLAFYVWFGRTSSSGTLRQATWIAAASQVMVALIPLLVIVATTVAIIAVGLLAVLALVFLLADRR